MDQGMLVGDDLVNKAVRAHVSRRDCANGFVLDGYPRTVAQARFLDACLAELEFGAVRVLWLDIAPTEVEARLLRRLQCPKCGRTYCSDSSPTGVCELDGSPLTHRGDDNVNVIRERLSQYEHNTAPLLDYYSGPRLRHISASGAPRQVAEFLLAAVNDYALETPAARSAHYAHAAV
jgi:adenylate kinase